MDVTATLDAASPAESLFPWVEDLARYPSWLDIVPRAESVLADPSDLGPAWSVDLRARLGPMARSKRLRMIRIDHQPPFLARFERHELDGRSHSVWSLTAGVESIASGSRLTMRLHYGGGLFGPVLERMLRDEIERSRPRLLARLGGG